MHIIQTKALSLHVILKAEQSIGEHLFDIDVHHQSDSVQVKSEFII